MEDKKEPEILEKPIGEEKELPESIKVKVDAFEERGVAKREEAPPPAIPGMDPNFLKMVERMAANPDVDVDKMEKVMNLQERVIDKAAEQSFSIDMFKCQSEIPPIPKRGWNDSTSSWYPLLEDIIKVVKPIYTKWGFSISFYEEDIPKGMREGKEGWTRTCADIMHRDGHTKQRHVDYPLDTKGPKGADVKTDVHGKKSSITYAKGTLLCMIFNIPAMGLDDDGNAAGSRPRELIDKKQAETIKKFIKDKNVNEPKFLEYLTGLNSGFSIESIEKIPKDMFNEAVRLIKEKDKKKKKPAPKEKPGENK
jgi:hypothetical protein